MTSGTQPDDFGSELTLSERVALANAWEEAVSKDEDSVVIELDIYPVVTESELPSTSFDTGPLGYVKRLLQGRKPSEQRSVPRQQV